MSKTVKIILVVAVLGIVILVCLCLLLGGVITLGTFLNTATPAPTMMPPTPVPVQATMAPPTPSPAAAEPQVTPTTKPAGLDTSRLLAAGDQFELDGVVFDILGVQYTLLNGGEDVAHFVSGDDGFLLIVGLSSNTKALDFVYEKYFDTIKLIDLETGETYEPDWANWSMDDSPTNSGYVMLSFMVQKAPEKAAIFFSTDLGIEITSLLPVSGEVENPWWDIKQKFEVYGMDLRVQSVALQSTYTSPDGARFQKDDKANKILIVRMVSSYEDLSGLADWYPILINPDDEINPYLVGYSSWSTSSDTGQGDIEFSFEVPPDMKTFILYVPYENLIDLTSVVQKK